jgi:hypothetical protein
MARPLTHLTHGISTRRPFHPGKTCSFASKRLVRKISHMGVKPGAPRGSRMSQCDSVRRVRQSAKKRREAVTENSTYRPVQILEAGSVFPSELLADQLHRTFLHFAPK